MKKFIMILALVATSAFAEPSFNQIQDLIGRQQYAAAEQGLEQIIKNHPNSAKAFYSMAQAQAGLGNLDKARYALNKATGLDPTLSFASQSQVASLQEALTPQVKKIEMVEESHWFRNTVIFLLFAGIVFSMWRWFAIRKRDEDEGVSFAFDPVTPSPTPSPAKEEPVIKAVKPEVKKAEKKVEVPPRGKETTVKYTPTYTAPAPQPVYSAPQPTHTTTVVNQSNDGFLTGMLVGNMLSSHHDHHDRVIEREVVREVPSKSYESSSSRSSSWDSDSSSSSWDSDSSSSSSKSSSWDSDSSSSSSWSSSSSSDSSWDSGSSSSDSSW